MTEPLGSARPLTFSIVIPAYNEASDIGQICEALLALTPEPEEIIFVDGASMGDTRRESSQSRSRTAPEPLNLRGTLLARPDPRLEMDLKELDRFHASADKDDE